jgi:hypothetical protein
MSDEIDESSHDYQTSIPFAERLHHTGLVCHSPVWSVNSGLVCQPTDNNVGTIRRF